MKIPVVSQVLPLEGEDFTAEDLGALEESLQQMRDGDVSPALTAEEESAARKQALPGDMGQGAHATGYQLQGGYAPPAPTGGHPYWVAYYFTINTGTEEAPIYTTVSREVLVPGDAVAECRGNTVVIHHEGVADTFRIGRVRPA